MDSYADLFEELSIHSYTRLTYPKVFVSYFNPRSDCPLIAVHMPT